MRNYHIRYKVEQWDKPVPESIRSTATKVASQVSVSSNDYGFCDDVFIASIIRNKEGEVVSVLLLDSISEGSPDRKTLELIKTQIEHHIEHHT